MAARLGGETGKLPKAGAIISFAREGHGSPTEYDHVAFVEKVYPDGSFLISETNYNGNPNYTFCKLSEVDGSISFTYIFLSQILYNIWDKRWVNE